MMSNSRDAVEQVSFLQHDETIATLLQVICDVSGMGFAAVARVTDTTWTACQTLDTISLGIKAGDQFDVATTICGEVRATGEPVIIVNASAEAAAPILHGTVATELESYVSVAIRLQSGEYFGNLCALHVAPATLDKQRLLSMFVKFASLVAAQLDQATAIADANAALLDEKAAGELREQFIAVVGHDLRNPLQAIDACSKLLERKLKDDANIALARRIGTSVKRMSALINDVLDLARGRLGSGVPVLLEPVVDLESVLINVVAELQIANAPDRIKPFLSIAETVVCDHDRVSQLVSNLLANALVHGSQTQPVRFDAALEGGELVLTVHNFGESMPAQTLDKIFSPFWRTSSASNRSGLGLGLYICFEIVKAHGGSLTVESTDESGTTFKARMPARPPGGGRDESTRA